MGSGDRPRFHTYGETIKNLQAKAGRGLAGVVLPDILEAEEMTMNLQELAVTGGMKPDYLAKAKLHGVRLLLHLELETNYRGNRKTQRRMLR